MKILAMIPAALILVSCASTKDVLPPLSYSYLPKYVALDSVGGTNTLDSSLLNDSSLTDFKSIPLDSGELTTPYETIDIPAGILISDRKAVQMLVYKAKYKSLSVQLDNSERLRRAYYDKSVEAEVLYQKNILDLRKDVKRTWFETNGSYVGFTAGVISTIAAGVIISKVSK